MSGHNDEGFIRLGWEECARRLVITLGCRRNASHGRTGHFLISGTALFAAIITKARQAHKSDRAEIQTQSSIFKLKRVIKRNHTVDS